jgi:hypothetical protein
MLFATTYASDGRHVHSHNGRVAHGYGAAWPGRRRRTDQRRAALLDEIGRCGDSTRQAYTVGAHSMIDAIARHLEGGDADPARERAIGLFTLLVGSLQLARASS